MNEIKEIPKGIDVKIVGSDPSLDAIKAAIDFSEKAGVNKYRHTQKDVR